MRGFDRKISMLDQIKLNGLKVGLLRIYCRLDTIIFRFCMAFNTFKTTRYFYYTERSKIVWHFKWGIGRFE